MYDIGGRGPGNYAEAAKWYRKAAEQGHAGAQTRLGIMNRYGTGVLQDYTEAIKLFQKAAVQGNADAISQLGEMYRRGQGVSRDYVRAHMWFNLSATIYEDRDSSFDAGQQRKKVAELMTLADVLKAQRMAREWLEAHKK